MLTLLEPLGGNQANCIRSFHSNMIASDMKILNWCILGNRSEKMMHTCRITRLRLNLSLPHFVKTQQSGWHSELVN